MAANIFTGATNSNWNVNGNWSLGVFPTAADGNTATFNAASPACTVNVVSACNALDFRGTGISDYANIITVSNGLTVAGNLTLSPTMTWVGGAAVLTLSATCTITSNGFTITSPVLCSGASTTKTLADDMRISGTSFQPSASATIVYSGAFTIYFSGTSYTNTNTMTSANTKLEFTGNVTLGSQQGMGWNEIRINTGSNTFTCNNTINLGSTANTTTLTYVSGTVVAGTSNLMTNIGNFVWDTYPIKWSMLNLSNGDNTAKTITINSPLLAKGIKLLGSGTATPMVFAGSYGFECDILYIIYSISGRTLTLSPGVIYKVNSLFTIGHNQSGQAVVNLNTSSSGQKAKILIGKYCNTAFANVTLTDIDNIGPKIVPIFQNPSAVSTLTRSNGWTIVPNGQAYISAMGAAGLTQGIVNGQF